MPKFEVNHVRPQEKLSMEKLRELAVARTTAVSAGGVVRDHYPLDFVYDYIYQVTRQQRRKRLATSMLGYAAVVITVFLLYFSGTEPSVVYDLERLTENFAKTDGDEWQKMESVGDFWSWIENVVLPTYYQQIWYTVQTPVDGGPTGFGHGTSTDRTYLPEDPLGNQHMFGYNLGVGAMRMQQKRVITDSCTFPEEAYRSGEHCYPYLSSDTEDKDDFVGAHSNLTYSFTESAGGEWYGLVPGQWAQYDSNGYSFNFVPNQTKPEWSETLTSLQKDIWIDYNTRTVALTVVTYNAGLNMWAVNEYQFELSPSGVIYKKVQSKTFSTGYSNSSEGTAGRNALFGATFWITLHFFINVLASTVADTLQYVSFRRWQASRKSDEEKCCTGGKIIGYFFLGLFRSATMWRVLDLLTSIVLFVWLVWNCQVVALKDNFNPEMDTTEFLDSAQEIGATAGKANEIMGLVLFLVLLKSFKFMKLSRSLRIIIETLEKSAAATCSYMVTFGVIFFGFAFWGHVSFGADMENFSTPVMAVQSSLDLMIGNGDLPGMFEANRVMGPLYYILFTVAVTLVLINVFIAIVSVSYKEAMAESARPDPFGHQNSGKQLFVYIFASMHDYTQKFFLVITLNLCFTSPVGLATDPEVPWEEVAIGRRMLLTCISTICYFFNLCCLFRFSGTGKSSGFTSDREFQIYERSTAIGWSLQMLRDQARGSTSINVGVDVLPLAFMFGDVQTLAKDFDGWLGPANKRFSLTSLQSNIMVYSTYVATQLDVLKQMAELRLTGKGKHVYSSLSSWDDRVTLLRKHQDMKMDRVALIEDFPLALVSLESTHLVRDGTFFYGIDMPVCQESEESSNDQIHMEGKESEESSNDQLYMEGKESEESSNKSTVPGSPRSNMSLTTWDEATDLFNADNTGKKWKSNASNEDKLVIYSLFKQQKDGDCNCSRPGVFSPTDRAKWDAWDSRKGMSAEQAQAAYIQAANEQKEKHNL